VAPRRPKHLTSDDEALWRRVTETVNPLKKQHKPLPPAAVPEDVPPKVKSAKTPVGRAAQPILKPKPVTPPPAPSLAPLDKRLTRRIAKGSRAVDAKIDLHGLNQREAHARLLGFLQVARARGHKLVLVVTGKGKADGHGEWWEEGNRGVLRRSVPEWLATPPFRSMVVGFERAHPRKGGDGALYVQIRRIRPTGEADR